MARHGFPNPSPGPVGPNLILSNNGKETKLELAMADSRNNGKHSGSSDMRVVNSPRKILEIPELFVTSLVDLGSAHSGLRLTLMYFLLR